MLAIGKPKFKQVGAAVAMAMLSIGLAPKPAEAFDGAAIVAAIERQTAQQLNFDSLFQGFQQQIQDQINMQAQGFAQGFLQQIQDQVNNLGLDQVLQGEGGQLLAGVLSSQGVDINQGLDALCNLSKQYGGNNANCLEDAIQALGGGQNNNQNGSYGANSTKDALLRQQNALGTIVNSQEQRVTEAGQTVKAFEQLVSNGSGGNVTEKQVLQLILQGQQEQNRNLVALIGNGSQATVDAAAKDAQDATLAAEYLAQVQQARAQASQQGKTKTPTVTNVYAGTSSGYTGPFGK